MIFDKKKEPQWTGSGDHARFLISMFITVLCSQAALVVDAAVGGNLLGPDSVSAVNLVEPVYELFYALVTLLGMGASIVASIASAKGDVDASRRYFTGAVVSSLIALLFLGYVIYTFREELLDLMCGWRVIREITGRYLVAMLPYFIADCMLLVLMTFTAMAGHTLLVMFSAVVQFAVNLLYGIFLIKIKGFGIEAFGYSSLLSAAAGLLIILPACMDRRCPFRLTLCPLWQLFDAIGKNVRYGGGMVVVNLSFIVMTFAMNELVLRVLGAQELFCWSVVMMMYLTGNYACSAAKETSLALGGWYLGSEDRDGFHKVYDRSLVFALTWIALILAFAFAFSRLVMPVFGAVDEAVYYMVLPVTVLSIPFIMGTNVLNLYLVRLVQKGKAGTYALLSSVQFLSIPAIFLFSLMLFPGYERYAFLALLPVQYLIIRKARQVYKAA